MRDRIVRYALPMFGSQIVQFAGSTTALLLLGRLGVDSLGGVAAPMALLSLCCAVFFGFTTGAMILTARAKGACDSGAVTRIAAQGLGVAFILGAAVAVGGTLFARSVLEAANVRPELLAVAVPYTKALALYAPLYFLYMMYAALFDGLGDFKLPNRMLAAFTVLFLALLVPLTLRFSATGVPLASIAAALCVVGAAALAAHKRHAELQIGGRLISQMIPTWRTMHDMLVLDLAVSAQYVGVALADLALVGIVNDYGPRAAAAYTVVNQIATFAMVPGIVLATAASAFGGEALTLRRDNDVQHAVRISQLLNVLITATIALAAYAFAGPLIAAFVHDPQAQNIATAALYVMLWSVLALNVGAVVSGLVDACGQTLWPMMATLAGVWLVLVPLAHLFSRHVGVAGVWEAYPYAYVSIGVMQLAYYAFARKRGYLNETAAI